MRCIQSTTTGGTAASRLRPALCSGLPGSPIPKAPASHSARSCAVRRHHHVWRIGSQDWAPRVAARAAAARSEAPDTLYLPLDYYRLLNVAKATSRDAIRRAYNEAISAQPEAGYSQDALFSRAAILKGAVECLTDIEARRFYDQQLAGGLPEVQISTNDLAGALALLQENGYTDLVIEYTTTWLQDFSAAPESKDIAVCLAMAYCDKAAACLELSPQVTAAAKMHPARARVDCQLQGPCWGRTFKLSSSFVLMHFCAPKYQLL